MANGRNVEAMREIIDTHYRETGESLTTDEVVRKCAALLLEKLKGKTELEKAAKEAYSERVGPMFSNAVPWQSLPRDIYLCWHIMCSVPDSERIGFRSLHISNP